jgi:hypothetical protein
MKVNCECDKWKLFLKEMDGLVMFASVHGIKYQSGVFKYCPWCGKKLVESE